MAQGASIAIFTQNPAKSAYLADIVRIAGFTPLLKGFQENVPALSILADPVMSHGISKPILLLGTIDQAETYARVISEPIKACELIDVIQHMVAETSILPVRIPFGDGAILDTQDNFWLIEGREPVRLTEKEVAILCRLKEAKGAPVSREELLNEVWSYADGVQTHTLETHIYRLRQKIEVDSANPLILITTEEGYAIK